ncbi:MAG: aspartyl/asparaginyl beta-hydroxylase domain-containing protein [Bryobacteraceae bacterium]
MHVSDFSKASVIDAVRDAKRHRGGLKMSPLFRLEPAWLEALRAEVLALQAAEGGSRVEDPQHPTHWVRPYGSARQFNLFNAAGRTDEFAWANAGAGKKRFWLEGMPALERLVGTFAEQLISFRLNELHPASGLNPHEEPIESKDGLILRFHLPVITNPGAWLVLDEERYRFEPGVLYFFNKGCVHAAINDGAEPRYHFVFDMRLNDWVYETLFNPAGAGPGDGFLRPDEWERERLATGEPYPIDEYVEGKASGEVLLFRKELDAGGGAEFRKSAKLTKDITASVALSFGRGWWGFEEWEGEQFRWASPETELDIDAEKDGMSMLRLEVAAGPSAAEGVTRLLATDADGAVHGEHTAGERGPWEIAIAVHRGQNRVLIRAENAGTPLPGESRLLSFRAFSAELAPG